MQPADLVIPAGAAPGVRGIVTAESAGKLGKGTFNTAHRLGGPEIPHYHQAIAVVVAETFEQARAAGHLIRVEYARTQGLFDLDSVKDSAKPPESAGTASETAASPSSSPRRCWRPSSPTYPARAA